MKRMRKPAVAGMFYPASPGELERTVRDLLENVIVRVGAGRVVGIIAPHAGYQYSGETAAQAYAQVQGQSRDVVVVIAPSHREFFDGISVYPGDGYETPLGGIPIDMEVRDRLREVLPGLMMSTQGHGTEHALEVQLPFLQCALQPFTLVPLVIGHQSRGHCFALGEALGEVCSGKDVLLVASTDLSHFSPVASAKQLDAVVAEDITVFDPQRLMRDLEAGVGEACGGGPVAAVMTACDRLGARRARILGRTHSGMVTGDHQSVVGYLSAVIQREESDVQNQGS
jgi:AmmeMemoRadiSam system protein B